ncbi:hypothetical protein [Paenibacillus sp. MMO-177]|uniref:hypothetical protein n=1 Tax=Paenibacillus sp. MMO-177 TaxID=3081289 RepID=UPI003019CFCA
MERYAFVENNQKVETKLKLKDYNGIVTLVWDYMEQSGFSYHGTVRDWSAVFYQETYYVRTASFY